MFDKELELRIQSSFNVPEISKDLHFINPRSTINWIKVVSADTTKIINEKDIGGLKENVLNVVNYDLETAGASKVLDPGFVKLFRLAQLTIEYLLHVQHYFQKRSRQLSEENIIMKQRLEKDEKETIGGINGQQSSFSVPDARKESHLVLLGNDTSNTFRCMLCGKIFLNGCYLYAHHQRRHFQSGHPSLVEIPSMAAHHFSSKLHENSNRVSDGETEKIWKELEWLRKKVYESMNPGKSLYQDVSQPEVSTKSNQSLQWARSDHLSPEIRNGAVPVRVNISTTNKNPDNDGKEKGSACREEERSKEHQMKKSISKEEEEAEVHFEQVEDSHQEQEENRNKVGGGDCNSFSVHVKSSPPVIEIQKPSASEVVKKEDFGRLEAQERVWRGRLKALADKSTQEVESLRKIISSLQVKESEMEEEYQEKIQRLTQQLKEKSFKPTNDKAVETLKEEIHASLPRALRRPVEHHAVKDDRKKESVPAVPPIPSIAEDPESSSSSRDASVTSLSPVRQSENRESPLISPASNPSEVRSKTSDSENESSDVSSSPNVPRRSMSSDHSSEDEESDQEMAIEVFEKKLRRLNINPSARSMPEKVFKEKMEILNAERRLMKRKIDNFHHIKSSLEEKADARVSQKMLRLKLDKPKATEETAASISGYNSPKDSSSQHRMKEFPSSASSKESLVATTSRSTLSSHSQMPMSGRTITSQSSLKSTIRQSEDDVPHQSRISVMAEKWKGSKGIGGVASNFHPKAPERHVLPGVSSIPFPGGIGGRHAYSSMGGSILRGLRHVGGEGERLAAAPSIGGYGPKSVSFAHDVSSGKVYHAV